MENPDVEAGNLVTTPSGDAFQYWQTVLITACLLTITILVIIGLRLITILSRSKPAIPRSKPTHLLIVLGSGGHTAEMLNILHQLPLQNKWTYRTYIVSSGDGFSATKAVEFEKTIGGKYNIVNVRRARRVHQGILTAPFTTLQCLWDCVKILRGSHPDSQETQIHPDIILTNGPGTGVCVVLASLILAFLGIGQTRTIFIESWARVRTLSLSGKILKPLVNRFIVQWPQLVDKNKAEYIGPLVR